MDDLNALSVPAQSQITIDSVAKDCPSEGFNYPNFRLLNKKARVYLSEDLNPDPSISYRLLAIANSRGWFAAVKSQPSGSGLVFSSLEDFRSAFADAKPDNSDADYSPRRLLSIPTKANLIAFSSDESQIYVGLEDGSVVVYDSASVLTPGTDDIQPSNRIQLQQTPLLQLVPNPGTEPALKDLVAVVGNDFVRLLNTRLESQGGWTTNGSMQKAVAIDWSPKGKHIAIGMQSGDILTFALTNKSTPHKHIPPTFISSLVSLTWLGPTHTFRTSYAATPDGPPAQHIIVLDTKSSTATYFAPDHPFPSFDRNAQSAYVLNLPKWDVDAGSNVNQSLVIVGDISSVDVEVLGSVGNQWHRQSQENPLSLPLDKSMEDTKLLSLEVDLTDRSFSAPIMYAYLNDGSVQAWHMDHSKPYLPMLENNVSGMATANSEMAVESNEVKNDADMGMSTQPSAGPATSVFGQSSFGQQSPSPFGSQTTSVFGQSSFSQSSTTTSFGQTSFGKTSSFGNSSGGSAFGQSNQSDNSTSAFGSAKPAAGFGAFGGSTSPFGSGAFGSNTSTSSGSSGGAFSNLVSSSSHNVFGQPSFIVSGSSNTDSKDASSSSTMTREASMSDSTPGFGGLSALGGSHPTGNAVNSMFGSFGQPESDTTSKETTSAFGGSLVKPATGFGAFGGALSSNSPFANNKPAPTVVSAFAPVNQAQQSTATSSGFATSGFGKSFAQPSFGQSSFGATAGSSTPSPVVSSGFGAFANKSVTLGGAEKPTSEATPSTAASSGFGAFANKPVSLSDTEKPSTFASSPAASTDDEMEIKAPTTSAFGSSSGAFSGFKPAAGFGAFGSQEMPKDSPFFKKPNETPTVSAFGAFSSAPKTPSNASANPAFGSPSALGSAKSPFTPQTPSTPSAPAPISGAFGAFSSAATGFSAFAGAKSSFSDLLKKGDDEDSGTPKATTSGKAKDDSEEGELKEEPRTSVFGTPKVSGSFKQDSPTSDKPHTSVFGTPTSTPKAKPPVRESSSATPTATPTKESVKSGHVEVGAEREGSDNEEQEHGQQSEEDGEHEDGEHEDGEHEDGEHEDGEHSDVDSFLSENFDESSYKDGDSINDDDSEQDDLDLPVVLEEEEEEIEEEASAGQSSTNVAASRSPSSAPQPELPSIKVSPSPDVDDDGSSKPALVRESSTTPPTTPIKEPKAPSTETAPVSSPATSPFGLGRPSTKPTRSSPLANAVLVGEDEEEKLETPSNPSLPVLSPKPVFGKLPLEELSKEVEETSTEAKGKRPQTPPLLSQMGPPVSKPVLTPGSSSDASSVKSSPPPSVFGLGAQPTAAASTPSLFGKPFEVPASPKPELKRATTAPPASATTSPSVFGGMPPFSISNATTTPLPSGPSSLFGVPKPPGVPPPGSGTGFFGKVAAISSVPPGGLFGSKSQATGAPMPSLFGAPPPAPNRMAAPSGSMPSPPQTRLEPPASPRPSQRVLEEGMQKECAFVVRSMEMEFLDLLKASHEARKEYSETVKSGGGSRFKKDLGNPKVWGLEDLPQFKEVVLQFGDDLEELSSWEEKQRQMLRDIRNSMLKAGTRKEEIVRFSKARDDKEFAKMLKTRTLGPEYTETQTALRKNIRAIRDRVQKLESSLQENKKKLVQATTMKPTFKAPSLDTINRTYRNIELTIDQQSEEVARLAYRVKHLRIIDQTSSPSMRDARLPDSSPHRRLVDYTPNIAETTAAALNAERSAQRLKKALLAIRKEPLLNKKATAAPPPPTTFDTPQKTSNLGSFAFDTPIGGPLFGNPNPAMSTSEFSLPNWDLPPDDNFNPSTPLAAGRRGGPPQRKHDAFKRNPTGSPVAAASAAPTSFDWGPLPSFATPPPASRLPAAFISFSSPSPTK